MTDLVEGTDPIERGVVRDKRHRVIVRTWVAVGFVVSQFALVIMLVLTLGALSNLSDDSAKSRCRDKAFSVFAASIGDAFAAPPSPNPSRMTAVEKIHAASELFRSVDKACG